MTRVPPFVKGSCALSHAIVSDRFQACLQVKYAGAFLWPTKNHFTAEAGNCELRSEHRIESKEWQESDEVNSCLRFHLVLCFVSMHLGHLGRSRPTTVVSGAGPLTCELQSAAPIPHPLHQRVRQSTAHCPGTLGGLCAPVISMA